jgi:hypothetical protein
MTKAVADNYPRSISQYVPNMEFAADVVDGKHIVSLGAPAALDADGIWDGIAAEATAATFTSANYKSTFDGSSTSLTSTSGMMDALYGRTITAVGTAGSNHVLTITGRDYLGQIMVEQLTLSGTTILYGTKAFKYVDTVLVAAGAASDTCDIGWTNVLGLPYASEQLMWLTEDDVQRPVTRRAQTNGQIWTTNNDASLFGSMASHDGFVVGQSYVATVANTTGTSALTVEIGGTAVAGLSITLATNEAIGDASSDFVGTNDNGLTSKVAAGGAIESVSNTGGTAGIGHIVYYIDEGCLFVDADRTATQTATTGDTRGTLLPYTACDGSVTYEVCYSVNTSDLHGIEQFGG